MKWAKAHFFVAIEYFGSMSSVVVAKIEAVAQRVAESEGIEVVEVELKGGGRNRFLRISIDKPGGVTHADCESITGDGPVDGFVLDLRLLWDPLAGE